MWAATPQSTPVSGPEIPAYSHAKNVIMPANEEDVRCATRLPHENLTLRSKYETSPPQSEIVMMTM